MSDQILEPPGSHEPNEHAKTPKKAAASGWIGSALEYYDFFIYAQAAALVFPNIFFPSDNPQVAIVAAFATFGVGYVARPIGAFVLGHWGDTHGRKTVLVLCMLLMGGSTFLVALLPTYAVAGVWAPILLVALRLIQGFAVGGEISGASAMILEHAPFGRRGYFASFTLQGVQAGQIIAAAVFLPLSAAMSPAAFQSWGWRIPFLLSALVVVAGYIIRRKVDETPAFQEEAEHGEVPAAPIVQAVRENGSDMLRVDLHGTDERHPHRGDGVRRDLRHERRLRRRADHHELPVDLGDRQRRRGDPHPVRRQPDRPHRAPAGHHRRLRWGPASWPTRTCTSSPRATSTMAFVFAILMWGIVYQGYNAVFPAFYQELFPTKTRVTAFAVSQNIGTLITAFLPAIYAALAGPTPAACVVNKKFAPDVVLPSGETCRAAADAIESDVVWTVGSITLGLAIIAAIAAFSARETYRVHLNDLGNKDARPVPKDEYDRIRREGMRSTSV